jgi:hypothetical protein
MMPEYIEREDVLNELNRNSITKKITLADGVSIFDTIKNIPAADVVEVVRCKDCKHIHLIGKTPFAVRVCTHNKGLGDDVRENSFCSYGKRKEGAEE